MKKFYVNGAIAACLLAFSSLSWADKAEEAVAAVADKAAEVVEKAVEAATDAAKPEAKKEKNLYEQTPPAPKTTKEEDEQIVDMFEVNQSVLKLSIHSNVSIDDSIESMKAKAAELNMKMVGHQQVSKELNARGVKARRLEILQFCNPEDAVKMVEFNPIYAAYMPCRISVLEDAEGKNWLLMLNLDMIINEYPLPEELQEIAITINGIMLEIVTAGSTGDF